MGIVRDLYYARKMGAGVNVPAPDLATYIHRKALAPKSQTYEGAVVEFDTAKAKKLKNLIVSLSPIQDLHGYDAPWAGGAGKNKIPLTVDAIKALNTTGTWSENAYAVSGLTFTVLTDSSNNVVGITVSGTASATVQFKLSDDLPLAVGTSYALNGCPNSGSGTTYMLRIYPSSGSSIATDSGSGATFEYQSGYYAAITVVNGTAIGTAVTFKPMIRLASVTDATFAPYSNLCPITGRTWASAYVNGINQWDEEWELGYLDPSTGGNASSNNCIRSKNYTPIVPSTAYYINVPNDTGVNAKVYFYDINKSFISWATKTNEAVSTPQKAYYMRFYMSDAYGTTYNHDVSINLPSTETNYSSYQGNQYSVSFLDGEDPLTVYSGTVDLVTGDGVLDMAEVDLGSLTWEYQSTYQRFRAESTAQKKTPNATTVANALCDIYKLTYMNQTRYNIDAVDNIIAIGNTDYIYAVDTSYNGDANAFKTGVTGHQLCYELAEPIPFHVSPQEIMSLVGHNVVFSPDGDVTVKV